MMYHDPAGLCTVDTRYIKRTQGSDTGVEVSQ